MGVGTGILVHDVNGMVPSEQAAGAAVVNEFTDNILIRGFSILSSLGSVAFITAAIAGGIEPIATPARRAQSPSCSACRGS